MARVESPPVSPSSSGSSSLSDSLSSITDGYSETKEKYNIYYALSIREKNNQTLIHVDWFDTSSRDPLVRYLKQIPREPIEPVPSTKDGPILVQHGTISKYRNDPLEIDTKDYWIKELHLRQDPSSIQLECRHIDLLVVPCVTCFELMSDYYDTNRTSDDNNKKKKKSDFAVMEFYHLLTYLQKLRCLHCIHRRKPLPRRNSSAGVA
jgi:hypothetical protein